jgi:hypothetical protein
MWAILVEMGCISQNSRSKTWGINNEGWEFLSAEFSVSKNIQVSPTNLRENGRRVHYIRMGFPVQDNPTVIWNEYKKKKIKFPPTTITSRVALKFVAVELLQILKGSNMFFKILQSYTGVNITELRGLDATLLSTSERNNRVVAQLLDNSDDETDTIDKDSDGIEENEEEGDGNQEEEAALESVAALLSAQADITVGEVADRNEFPMMHKLNVSINSRLKIIELHKELLWYLQKTQPEDDTRLTCSFCYDVNSQLRLFFLVPKGVSKNTLQKLQKTIKMMVKHCAGDGKECLKSCATSVIQGLESEFKDSFLEVAKDRGYSSSLAGKMSAEYWNAMAEAANLRTTQQIQLSSFLTQHFGHKVVVSQRELAAFGSEFVPYETFH